MQRSGRVGKAGPQRSNVREEVDDQWVPPAGGQVAPQKVRQVASADDHRQKHKSAEAPLHYLVHAEKE